MKIIVLNKKLILLFIIILFSSGSAKSQNMFIDIDTSICVQSNPDYIKYDTLIFNVIKHYNIAIGKYTMSRSGSFSEAFAMSETDTIMDRIFTENSKITFNNISNINRTYCDSFLEKIDEVCFIAHYCNKNENLYIESTDIYFLFVEGKYYEFISYDSSANYLIKQLGKKLFTSNQFMDKW